MRFLCGLLTLLLAGAAVGQPARPFLAAQRLVVVKAASEEHIQAELKTTDDQKAQIAAAEYNYQNWLPEAGQDAAKHQAVVAATEAAVRAALSPEQFQRLRQILAQREVRLIGLVATLRGEAARGRLGLAPEQVQRLDAVAAATGAALKKAVAGDEPPGTTLERVAAVAAEHEKQLLGVLNPEQRAKWQAALGPAFKDEAPARPSPFGPAPGPAGVAAMGAVASLPYSLVAEPVVQKTLGLNEEQVKKLPALNDRKAREILDGLLTDEQTARLGQLALQAHERYAGRPYLFRFKAVVDAVAPTAEQKQAIEPLYRRAGTAYLNREIYPADQRQADAAALAKILTAEQQAKLAALLGKPHEGVLPDTRSPRATIGAPNRPSRPLPSALAYLLEPDVQKELVLTADRVAGVADTKAKLDERLKEASTAPRNERVSKRTAAEKEADAAALKLLSAEQRTRLEQLKLQHRATAAKGAAALFRDATVAEALRLTGADVERIEQGERDLERLDRFVEREVPLLLGGPGDEVAAAYETVRDRKQQKLLTAEQKARWEALLGKPYDGKFPTPRLNFGSGGPGTPPGSRS